MPFCIPLPDNLPPSLYYAGEMMSVFQVRYELSALLMGLIGSGGPGHEPTRQLVIQDQQILYLRAVNPPPQPPITVQQEGKVTAGPLGILGKGSTKIKG